MTVSAPAVRIRDLEPGDREWATALITAQRGARIVVRLGEELDPLELPGLVAESGGVRAGLATVHEAPESGLEVVTLDASPPGSGAGTALLETAFQVAGASGHRRLWGVVSGTNMEAIHFCLRRGLHVARVHDGGAVEMELAVAGFDDAMRRVAFPRVEDLNLLPVPAFAHEVGVLFEGAPRFLARVAAARPFETDGDLLAAAARTSRELPAEEAIELVDAHPRIGAAPSTVSVLSHAEQGYDADVDHDAAAVEREAARIAEELDFLNDAYERIHGFRYAVFVAGRPRADLVPLLEVGLRNETAAELRRGVDECLDIAADRLARLRAA